MIDRCAIRIFSKGQYNICIVIEVIGQMAKHLLGIQFIPGLPLKLFQKTKVRGENTEVLTKGSEFSIYIC